MVVRLCLSLVVFGLCAVAVVRPRIVTITNSADALTLELHFEDFLDTKRFKSEHTVRAYQSDLGKFLKFVSSDRGVAQSQVMYHEVQAYVVDAFLLACLQHESPGTVQRRLKTVKAFTNFIKDKYQTTDRAAGVANVVLGESDFLGLTNSQRDQYLLQLEKESPRRRIIGHIFLATGLREMSLQDLRFGHLRPDWSWVDGVKVKGRGRKHRVPISRNLRQELTRYIDAERSHLPMGADWPVVTCEYKSKLSDPESWRVSVKTIWRDVHEPMIAAGIPSSLAHPHTLRHTFALDFLARLSPKHGAAEALKLLMKALGHTSVKTTMKYLTVNDPDLMEAFEA